MSLNDLVQAVRKVSEPEDVHHKAIKEILNNKEIDTSITRISRILTLIMLLKSGIMIEMDNLSEKWCKEILFRFLPLSLRSMKIMILFGIRIELEELLTLQENKGNKEWGEVSLLLRPMFKHKEEWHQDQFLDLNLLVQNLLLKNLVKKSTTIKKIFWRRLEKHLED